MRTHIIYITIIVILLLIGGIYVANSITAASNADNSISNLQQLVFKLGGTIKSLRSQLTEATRLAEAAGIENNRLRKIIEGSIGIIEEVRDIDIGIKELIEDIIRGFRKLRTTLEGYKG